MIPLPTFDLSALAVGQKGSIILKNAAVSSNPTFTKNKPILHLFNESGSGLQITLPTSGSGFYLPAGGWTNIEINPGENQIDFLVIYVLPSPPVQVLLCTYYAPGENIPATPTLGNSPIGIGGNVSVTSISALSNEGSAVGTLVIDIGPLGNTNIIQIWNDHFTWSVVQGGVAHTVMQGQTAGNPLLLGKLGDITEVLGKLLADQIATFSAGILSQISGQTVIDSTGANLTLNSPGVGSNINFQHNTTQDFHSGPGFWLDSGSINLIVGSITKCSFGVANTVANQATITHNLGQTPTAIFATRDFDAAASGSVSAHNISNTQARIWSSVTPATVWWLAIV
jgi:hypothetical protein